MPQSIDAENLALTSRSASELVLFVSLQFFSLLLWAGSAIIYTYYIPFPLVLYCITHPFLISIGTASLFSL